MYLGMQARLLHGSLDRGQAGTGSPYGNGGTVLEDVCHVAHRRTGIHGHGNAACGPHGVEGKNPALTVLGEDEGTVALVRMRLPGVEGGTLQEFREGHVA